MNRVEILTVFFIEMFINNFLLVNGFMHAMMLQDSGGYKRFHRTKRTNWMKLGCTSIGQQISNNLKGAREWFACSNEGNTMPVFWKDGTKSLILFRELEITIFMTPTNI